MQTERSPTPEFVPLSAEVVSQMTLFGGAEPLPAPPPAATRWRTATAGFGSIGRAPNRSPPRPHSSAGRACARSATGSSPRSAAAMASSHREINQWLNRKVGIASVEQATIPELERSVDLLMKRLTARR